jgi:glycosyltransferase involved in cell wall biosynthesis
MKILFISRYVEPYPIGANRNVFLQAKSLQDDFGLDVQILTWPLNDLWTGPMPEQLAQVPALKVVREGLTYHVFTAPLEWNEAAGGNVLEEQAWEDAVAYGIKLLQSITPDIVHLQHRHGLWWLLDSAQRLGIPTVYSNHDWGLACMRTVLVMGDNALCDGQVAVDKCAQCIVSGRGFIGRFNEILVQTSAGQQLVALLERTPLRQILRQRGIVRHSAQQRAAINFKRAKRLLTTLQHCFTPSEFGEQFFTRMGVKSLRISVMPWYHDPVKINKTLKSDQPFTMTYIGRVSPEKGVHLIFSALELVRGVSPIQLRIAGANDSPYCKALQAKYPKYVGIHDVQWLGWSKVDKLYNSTDVAIIPSLWIDNTPLSLIEALSYQVPVVATRIPPIEELVTDGQNAFLAEYLSVDSMAEAIRQAESQKVVIRAEAMNFPSVLLLKGYMSLVVNIYRRICRAE